MLWSAYIQMYTLYLHTHDQALHICKVCMWSIAVAYAVRHELDVNSQAEM